MSDLEVFAFTPEAGATVIAFPNPDEVTNGPRRFVIEDTRCFIVFAEDEEAALDAFCEMNEEEAFEAEVEGGGIEVYPADN